MPIGILVSRGALKDVEDPQHLRRVLAGGDGGEEAGRKAAGGRSAAEGLNGEAECQDQQQRQQQQQEWGGEQAAQNYGADSTMVRRRILSTLIRRRRALRAHSEAVTGTERTGTEAGPRHLLKDLPTVRAQERDGPSCEANADRAEQMGQDPSGQRSHCLWPIRIVSSRAEQL